MFQFDKAVLTLVASVFSNSEVNEKFPWNGLPLSLFLHVFFVYTVPVEKPEILITIYIPDSFSKKSLIDAIIPPKVQ